MFEEKKKEIDGIMFGVTPFMAGEAIRVQAHLVKLFAVRFEFAVCLI